MSFLTAQNLFVQEFTLDKPSIGGTRDATSLFLDIATIPK